MINIPLLIVILFLAGCSVKTVSVPVECRHTAVTCAPVVQEE